MVRLEGLRREVSPQDSSLLGCATCSIRHSVKWNFEQRSPSATRPQQLSCDLSHVATKTYHPMTGIKTRARLPRLTIRDAEPLSAALKRAIGDTSHVDLSPHQETRSRMLLLKHEIARGRL